MVGDASAINVDAARARAASMLAAIRGDADSSPDAMRFETVAETVFRRYARVWKPRTLYVNRSYLRCQILPWFAETQIADITRADVQRWFASCRATPVAADRSMPVLSVIMKEAERMGYRPEGSNPCRGIRRYRRKGRERFLSDTEIRRLAATLLVHEGERLLEVAAVRLLLLTVDGGPKAPKSGEHKMWGLTFWIAVFSQSGSLTAGSLLPAMKASCVRGLRRVTRRAGAQRRSRGAA